MATQGDYAQIDKKEKVIQFMYYVTKLGLTQKEAASLLNISEKLAGKWVKQHKLKTKINKLKKEMDDNPLKFDYSLSAFKAWVRIKHPELNHDLQAAYKRFLNTL